MALVWVDMQGQTGEGCYNRNHERKYNSAWCFQAIYLVRLSGYAGQARDRT